jgi:hypothetical protein
LESQERLAALRLALGDECFATQWERGKTLDIRDAIAQAQAPAEQPALVE